MPYNNAAIPAPEEITGQAALPLARVKKIIGLDEDIAQCSNNAAFAITVATEMFIRYLAEQGYNVVKSERKPRRNMQYKDLANAVSRIDNLEFLSDVIPKTTTYKQFKEKKAREAANAPPVELGQTTLDGTRSIEYDPMENGTNGDANEGSMSAVNGVNGVDEITAPAMSASLLLNRVHSANGAGMVDRTVEPAGHAHPNGEDLEMVE